MGSVPQGPPQAWKMRLKSRHVAFTEPDSGASPDPADPESSLLLYRVGALRRRRARKRRRFKVRSLEEAAPWWGCKNDDDGCRWW